MRTVADPRPSVDESQFSSFTKPALSLEKNGIDDDLILAMAVADGVLEPRSREDASPAVETKPKPEFGGGD